jgi:hypothetical protein
MGMVWIARLANDEIARQLIDNPDSAYDYLNPDVDGDLEMSEPFPIDLDLDKEWHGVHFLLTDSGEVTDSPLSLVLGNFAELGDDIGYGPVQYIPAEKVLAFHHALKATPDEEISARFDPVAMQAKMIYLADTFAAEGEEARGFLMERIQQLRDFAKTAAECNLHAFSVIT